MNDHDPALEAVIRRLERASRVHYLFRLAVLALLLVLLFLGVTHRAHAQAPAPRCLPGAYPNNFAVGTDAAGDTLVVLWCDDAQGLGVSVIGGNLTPPTGSCLAALQAFVWTVPSLDSAWSACVTASPSAAQATAAASFAAAFVPQLHTVGGPVVNAAGTQTGVTAPGIPCALTRRAGNPGRWYLLTPGAYAQCAITYAPFTSPSGATIPASSSLTDAQGNVWTVTKGAVSWTTSTGVALAGYTANVILLLYYNGSIYQENSAHNWWVWNGATWTNVGGDPR